MLTNCATAEMRKKCLALGADCVFDKSNELDELIQYCVRRGYLLSSRDDYLEPYTAALGSVREAQAWLRRYYCDDNDRIAEPRIGAIKADAEAKLAELSQTLEDERGRIARALNNGIDLKRRIIEDLRPSSLSNLGLKAAIEVLPTEVGQRADLKITMQIEPFELDEASEITLYRVVQESLTNVVEYAAAGEVHIELVRNDNQIKASVRDNGPGFDADRVRSSAQGLVGMRYRVQARGGRLHAWPSSTALRCRSGKWASSGRAKWAHAIGSSRLRCLETHDSTSMWDGKVSKSARVERRDPGGPRDANLPPSRKPVQPLRQGATP